MTLPVNLPTSNPAVHNQDHRILDCTSEYVPSGSRAASDYVRSQAWMYLFMWLFGLLHHRVFHNCTGLGKQLEN